MSGSWASAAGRVVLTVNGTKFNTWTSLSLRRDLREITGQFTATFYDMGRAAAAMPATAPAGPVPAPILRRQSCQVSIDGELVLDGWITKLEGEWTSDALTGSLTAHDKTIDLAECAAAPTGPAEWHNVSLIQVAQQVCSPFGITVRAETDVGAPFPRLALNPHETALSLLEKAARQRGVLVVSDGVGGLLLTTGGRSPAPADVRAGANAQQLKFAFDDSKRFSDVYVKGQSEKRAGYDVPSGPPLGHDTLPTAVPAIAADAGDIEAAGILMTGHAVDPEVTRYRPTVKMTRTQSGSATQQQQAEWWVRVARGESTHLTYSVLDFRAGAANALWKPNQAVRVWDPYAGIDDRMLISALEMKIGPDGQNPSTPVTEIEVVGLTAFDRINEATPKRPLKAP